MDVTCESVWNTDARQPDPCASNAVNMRLVLARLCDLARPSELHSANLRRIFKVRMAHILGKYVHQRLVGIFNYTVVVSVDMESDIGKLRCLTARETCHGYRTHPSGLGQL